MQEAFVSGQIGKAIYLEGDDYFVVHAQDSSKPIRCYPMDLSIFFNFGAEIAALPKSLLNITHLHDELSADAQRQRALTLTVSGMDHVLDLDTRKHAILTAAALTQTDSIYHFVRARLLSRPAPDDAELEAAIDIAVRSKASNMAALYQSVLELDKVIALVYESWLKTAQEHLSTQRELLQYQRILTDLGVFSDFVSALASNSIQGLRAIVVRYGRQKNFSEFHRLLQILNSLKTTIVGEWGSSTFRYEKAAFRVAIPPTQSTIETFQPGDIAGVVVRDLRRFGDSRGWLSELFRNDDLTPELFPTMGYVSSTKPGVTRGPHEHVDQTGLFCFLGPSNFKLHMWDHRLDSPTFGNVMTLIVGADNPKAVLIPKEVVHAYENIGNTDGIVINYPNRLYMGEGRLEAIDEIRHEDDPHSIFRMDD